MKTRLAAGLLWIVLGVSACGGSGEEDAAPAASTPTPAPTAPPPGIGSAGGTVTGPASSQVVIPAGALANNTAINVALTSGGAPALPQGFTAVGQMFAFTPHGTTFSAPVTMTIPFDPASIPAGRTPVLLKTNAQNQWEPVLNATFGVTSASGEVTSFSDVTAAFPPIDSVRLERQWSFTELRTEALEEVVVAADTQVEGELHELFDQGPATLDGEWFFPNGENRKPDGIATSEIFSSAGGGTYWVATEAPRGNIALPDDPIGSKAQLIQLQTFVKNADDATYEFTLSDVIIELVDGNGLLERGCPQGRRLMFDPSDPDEVLNPTGACDLLRGEVYLDVQAYTDTPGEPREIFFRTAGRATLTGSANDTWATNTPNEAFSRTPLWVPDDFEFAAVDFKGPDGQVGLLLKKTHPFSVPLSKVGLGKLFTVKVQTHALAYDRAASPVNGVGAEAPTAAHAYLRDPLKIGGTTVVTTGLTPLSTPSPADAPAEVPVDPAPCVPGPGPNSEAGTLQFIGPAFRVTETTTTPVINVTRTGGSTGAVTATFATSNGSAIGAVDYTPVNATVFFADGDDATRTVDVPILQDTVAGEPDKIVNLTLSQPGGCVALGTPATATLVIVDDDPVPPAPSGLDTTFDTDGKATLAAFGGDRSAMALQPDGKIVMVGGTFGGFILARFNADGSLDTGFGASGKVATVAAPGVLEEALAVALQSDGKIVVVGRSNLNFALARYNANGSLDATFGVGGRVVTGVVGSAFAVAIQSDNKIVAGGRIDGDVQLARYNPDGTLDSSFGVNGKLATPTDIVGDADAAANIVILPSGEILVSGGSSVGGAADPTGLARYLPNGSLDTSFGTGGKVILDESVGEGLARQPDGRLVLVGSIETLVSPATRRLFRVMRLNENGSVDSSFGTAGKVSTALSERGDLARAVTLRDGKIIVAGIASSQTNPNFAVARYNGDGTLDTTFNGDGLLTIDFFSSSDIAESVAIQPNGRIVLGGSVQENFVEGYGVARVVP